MRRIIAGLIFLSAAWASDIRSDEVRGAHWLTTVGIVPRVTALGQIDQSKLSCTAGNPGTCTLYDDTAVTGVTSWYVRAGINQGAAPTALVYFLAAGGGAMGGINADNTIHTLGGWTNAFPAIKRSGADVQVRLADDTLYAYVDTLGVKIGGLGTGSRYLKGNATAFVISTGAASGTGACGAGQFASAVNDDAAPTCAAPSASGYVLGYAALNNVNRLTKVTAAGTIGESALSENATSVLDTAALTYGLGTWARTGNVLPGTNMFVVYNNNLAVLNSATLGSESLTDGTFTVPTWTRTGDFTVNTGAAVYTHNTGVGTFTQLNAAMAIAVAPARWYKLVGDVSTTGTAPVCVLTAATADTSGGLLATLRTAAGVGVDLLQFKSAAVPTGYVTSCTSGAAGTVTYDNLVLKEIQGGDIDAYGVVNSRGGTVYGGSGNTERIIRAGLTQTTHLQTWRNSANVILTYMSGAGTMQIPGLRGSNLDFAMGTMAPNGYGIEIGGDQLATYPMFYSFSTTQNATGIPDVGFARDGAGTVQVMNGVKYNKWASLKAGTIALQSLATPAAPGVAPTCVPGVCNLTWSYNVAAVLGDGTSTQVGAVGSTALQNGTIDANSYNTLTVAPVAGATSYRWYRTVSAGIPATLGLIGTTTAPTLVDNGLAGDTVLGPDQNRTGQVSVLSAVWNAGLEGACAAANRGRVVMVQGGGGVADTFRVCSKDGFDVYAWRALY